MPEANHQPESNDDRYPVLEGIDSSELNLNDDYIPTVEALRPPGFGFWKAFLWCLLFVLCTQGPVIVIVVGGLLIGIKLGWISPPEDATNFDDPTIRALLQVAMFLTPIFIITFSIIVLRQRVGRDWYRRIGMRLPTIEHVILVLVAFPAFEVLLRLLEIVLKQFLPGMPVLEQAVKSISTGPVWFGVLLIGVGPAIGEELWCRGFLGRGLSARYGFVLAAVYTSFFFGFIHLQPLQAVFAMAAGCLLHFSYLATRSLLIPMLLHCLHNSLLLLQVSSTYQIPFHQSLELALMVEPFWFPFAALLLAATTSGALYQYRVRVHLPRSADPAADRELIPRTSGASLLPKPLHPGYVIAVVVTAALFGWLWL